MNHQLLLNEAKAEILFSYTCNTRVPSAITRVDVCGCDTSANSTRHRNFLGSEQDMSVQVACTCRAACLQQHNIAKIRYGLTIDACHTINHGLVITKLNYGNAVLFRIKWGDCYRNCNECKIQWLNNAEITTTLHLCWLNYTGYQFQWHITYKILVQMFRAIV